MARRRLLLLKTSALILSQLGILLALNFQVFGMALVHQMIECKRNLALAAHISARKSYIYRRKQRQIRARQVRRKSRSVWVVNGRIDQWWRNMIGEDVPDWCWKKNFRMSKECFYELVDELRRTQTPLIDGLLMQEKS